MTPKQWRDCMGTAQRTYVVHTKDALAKLGFKPTEAIQKEIVREAVEAACITIAEWIKPLGESPLRAQWLMRTLLGSSLGDMMLKLRTLAEKGLEDEDGRLHDSLFEALGDFKEEALTRDDCWDTLVLYSTAIQRKKEAAKKKEGGTKRVRLQPHPVDDKEKPNNPGKI